MSLYSPPPQTELEQTLLLAPLCAALGLDPQRLSGPETELLLAHHEHQAARAAIQQQLGALSPPYIEEGKAPSAEQISESNRWQRDYDELQLMLVQEDQCWAQPLDSEFGESLTERPLTHWLRAPGLNWHGTQQAKAEGERRKAEGKRQNAGEDAGKVPALPVREVARG